MVTDIARQAVELKLQTERETTLISAAEYVCACGMALRRLNRPELLEEVRKLGTVEEIKAAVTSALSDAGDGKLYHMLRASRFKGPVTDEIRPLFDEA